MLGTPHWLEGLLGFHVESATGRHSGAVSVRFSLGDRFVSAIITQQKEVRVPSKQMLTAAAAILSIPNSSTVTNSRTEGSISLNDFGFKMSALCAHTLTPCPPHFRRVYDRSSPEKSKNAQMKRQNNRYNRSLLCKTDRY